MIELWQAAKTSYRLDVVAFMDTKASQGSKTVIRKFTFAVFSAFLVCSCRSFSPDYNLSAGDSPCSIAANSCTFVLLDENSARYHIVNRERANKRYTPASTFKIANSLIALETGTLSGSDVSLRVDLSTYPQEDWWQPQWATETYDLRGAFQNSVYPIYRSIATDIGPANMQSYLNRFEYGNQDISSGLDSFWVAGSLEISAMEQIHFLQKLYHNEFALRQSTLDELKTIMLVEDEVTYKLFAKSGAALLGGGNVVFWYVGFVEDEAGVHYFAFNMHREPSPKNAQLRIDLSREYLRNYGVI